MEIGGLIPRNGAEVAYLKEGKRCEPATRVTSIEPERSSCVGIGSVNGLAGDILAYLFTWTNTFVLKPSALAVLTLTFAQYFLSGVMDGTVFSFSGH